MVTLINLQRERILRNKLDVWQKDELVRKHTKRLIEEYVKTRIQDDGLDAIKYEGKSYE